MSYVRLSPTIEYDPRTFMIRENGQERPAGFAGICYAFREEVLRELGAKAVTVGDPAPDAAEGLPADSPRDPSDGIPAGGSQVTSSGAPKSFQIGIRAQISTVMWDPRLAIRTSQTQGIRYGKVT